MPTVNFKINSKNYSVDCGEGQENQIISIANQIDAKVKNLSSMFGDVDSETLLLMVCILTFGDVQKSKTKISTLESKITELETLLSNAQNSMVNEDEIVDVINELTTKIKRLSLNLASISTQQNTSTTSTATDSSSPIINFK